MNVNRDGLSPVLLVLLATLLHWTAASGGGSSVSVTTHGDAIEDCDDIEVRFGPEGRPLPLAREERSVTLDDPAIDSLTIELAQGNGVYVSGWERDTYAIRACLAAGARRTGDCGPRMRVAGVGQGLSPAVWRW